MSELAQAEAPSARRRFEAGAAFVDGSYVPIDEARISILDTGFSRSDLTYDVVAVWDGHSSASAITSSGSRKAVDGCG